MESQQCYKHEKNRLLKIVIVMFLYIRTQLRLHSTLGIFLTVHPAVECSTVLGVLQYDSLV